MVSKGVWLSTREGVAIEFVRGERILRREEGARRERGGREGGERGEVVGEMVGEGEGEGEGVEEVRNENGGPR